MYLEKMALNHKDLLQDRLKSVPVFISEYSFANLYLFRNSHDHHVIRDGEHIFITGKTYDGYSYIMPTQDPRIKGLDKLLDLAKAFDLVFPIPQEWLSAFKGSGFEPEVSEGDSDYVFTVEKLSTYKGQKLHSKKNLLNQFLSLYTPVARPLTMDRMPDARKVLENWQKEAGESNEATDYVPCGEALKYYEELVLCGGIYYVEKEPVGFIIGEELNDTMFALHFAKGNRKFKGVYQYMFNQFANILLGKYQYLNFEQDLGKQALRIAKSSYHPDQILEKYRLRRKPQNTASSSSAEIY
jgi:hypothetical protein